MTKLTHTITPCFILGAAILWSQPAEAQGVYQPGYQQQYQRQDQAYYQYYQQYYAPQHSSPFYLELDDWPVQLRTSGGYIWGTRGHDAEGALFDVALGIRISGQLYRDLRLLVVPEFGWLALLDYVIEEDGYTVNDSTHSFDQFATFGCRFGIQVRFFELFISESFLIGGGYDHNVALGFRTGLGLSFLSGGIGVEINHLWRSRPLSDESLHSMSVVGTMDMIALGYHIIDAIGL